MELGENRLLKEIQTRRSIRKYQPRPVERQVVTEILEAALRAPSSKAKIPWEFVVVDQPQLLQQLAGSKAIGSAFLREAPLCIVVCVNPERSDVWIEDGSVVASVMMLAAQNLGLGSCWVQFRERLTPDGTHSEDFVRATLGIPQPWQVLCGLALGYPAEERAPYKKEELNFEKVHYNQFQD